ncbi:MAG: transglycosylase domain-containing protein [Bacteroidales bacterium]|nr:transglycosylase domain-containing protein [Bacteroidales bacterium]
MLKNLPTPLKYLWKIVFAGLIFMVLLFFLISVGALGFMPTFEDLENPQKNIASEIYSEDGQILGTFYYENRNPVEFDDLSPWLIKALISREDHRFLNHSGIDMYGLMRVGFKTILLGQSGEGGGSTITQQLAKNLFPRDTTHHSGPVRIITLSLAKFKEWVTAVKLERNYTKEEIAAMYLNTVPFGSESFGIKSAARTFFNKAPIDLTVEEAALLIGVVKGPTMYSPVRNPERSLARRNSVLTKMYDHHFLTREERDSLSAIPIVLNFRVQNHNAGVATYFREYLRRTMNEKEPSGNSKRHKEWEENPLYGWCNKNFKPNGEPYNLYKDGLRIYTTINYDMQVYGENALQRQLRDDLQPLFDSRSRQAKFPFSDDLSQEQINSVMNSAMRRTDRYRLLKERGASESEIRNDFNTPVQMRVFSWKGEKDTLMTPMDSIRYYKSLLRASFMAMDPHTGYVKAYVGGPDFRYFKYDGIKDQARQVGSTIKPFLYMLAMQEGYSPCYKVPNVEQTFILANGDVWTPGGSPTSKDGQMVTLRWGLANSVNNISAWLVKNFPPESIIEVLRRMGITSPIDAVPSICLGVPDISLYEMVGAYSTFANKGVYTEPMFVTRIEDRNGNLISTFTAKTEEAISENTAYLMVNLLQGVVQGGTAGRLRWKYNLTSEIGGKTGTTQNHSDGWFMGVTPNLVAGVWVGGEDRAVHFNTMTSGQGSAMALPIFGMFLQQVYANGTLGVTPADVFTMPQGFNVNIYCDVAEENNNERVEE